MNSKTYTKISCKNEGFEMGVFKGFYERLQFHQLRINSLCYIFVVKQVLPHNEEESKLVVFILNF
jgi:hypothetical protein